jgi:pimeloyl-ACP methyl ester carboxylesterase
MTRRRLFSRVGSNREDIEMTAQTGTARAGSYVDAGGLHTYYEVHGAGDPLVLLHGGLCTAETLDGQVPAFAERYRVYVPERRGHGRTPDVEGPITYQNMAADTAAFMDARGIRAAHLVGFSDGGSVALRVALDRPDLVAKLVVVGSPAHYDGCTSEQKALFDKWAGQPPPPVMEQFGRLHAAVSPDGPDHFPVLFSKAMWDRRTEPGLSFTDLAAISAPTLVLLADDDCLTIEHAAAMRDALPDAQLAVVPGTSHALPFEKRDLVNVLILDFLAAVQVTKLLSLADLLSEG